MLQSSVFKINDTSEKFDGELGETRKKSGNSVSKVSMLQAKIKHARGFYFRFQSS